MTEIKYKDTIIEVEAGKAVALHTKDTALTEDVVITADESAVPVEVSTEAEMTAVLETAEVGSVYKYVGESGTYENGALYVVEEESGYTVSVTSNYRMYVYDTPPTDTNGTGALGEVKKGETVDFKITTGKLYGYEPSVSNLKSHSETGGVTFDGWGSIVSGVGGYFSGYTITGDGTISQTYGGYD